MRSGSGCIRSRSFPELQAGITDEQRAEWLASDPADWANDSFAIAREPDVGYCVVVGDTCQYAADNAEFEEGEPERVVRVDDGYLDRHATIARERTAMAGARSAGSSIGRWGIRAPSIQSRSHSKITNGRG